MASVLKYSEFIDCNYWAKNGPPRHNNMFFYFLVLDESVYDEVARYHQALRERPFYVEAARRNPSLFGSLVSKVTDGHKRKVEGRISMMDVIVPLQPAMYEAYRYMREYGGSDDDIFL